ncbi:MAG TPA: VWA domain-containing protein [Vicinamibacterales bacterium]|jgi:VWFA-related protein
MTVCRVALPLVVGFLACVAVLAPRPAILSAQAPPQTQAVPSFRGGTTVVEVDVIVRDKNHQFVADLRASDFEVLDDGVPQDISALYQVIGPGEQAAPSTVAPQVPLPAPPPQQVQRVLILYFDQAHLQPGGFDRARKAALGFLQKEFREGDVAGIVNGSSMVNNRLTSSREELEAAVRGIKPFPEASEVLRALRTAPRFVDITEALRVTRREPGYNPGPLLLDDVVARACRDQPESCQDAAHEAEMKATQLVDHARLTGRQTLDTVAAVSNGLARLPGRKTLILLSDGFFTEDTWADLRGVVGRAARASVRIYSLDTRGLNRGSAGSDIFTNANPSQPEMSAMSSGDTNADGPNSLAVDTGGYVIRNENDFGKAFAEIDRDTSSYYVIGFLTSKPPDGKFHQLTVRTTRSGVTVRARKGYVAYTDTEASKAGAGASPAAPENKVAAAPAPSAAPVPPVTPLSPPPPAAAPVAAGAVVTEPGGKAMPGAVRAKPRTAEEIVSIGGGAVAPKSESSLTPTLRKQASDGWEAYQHGDVRKAKALLADVAAQPAAPPWTMYVLGWSHLALGETAPAAASWEKVRGAVPQFEPVYFDLADAYQQQGDFSKAIAVLRDAEGRWPKDVEVYSALGVIQLARGAVDDAIATFMKGVTLNGKDANVCYNLAKTYEVRWVRSERLRKIGPGSINQSSVLEDRMNAIAYYQRVVALGGPLVEAARDGLKRLGQE